MAVIQPPDPPEEPVYETLPEEPVLTEEEKAEMLRLHEELMEGPRDPAPVSPDPVEEEPA